ncbi:MAG: amidohydrolase [Chromatiales bacterium]|jgi:predicted TIM-barrel fold metal-dependent hydrolase|nr:amidohydrolase [Chromatiales bacterium]
MSALPDIPVNPPNLWRLDTPGASGWVGSARPGHQQKYFMVSTDCHANEPADLWAKRIEPEYRERLPRITTDEHGVKWRVSEGYRPDRLRISEFEGEDKARAEAGADPLDRLVDHDRDGIEAEVIFPNKGLAMWATPDSKFAMAQCRVWNTWAWEVFGEHNARLSPVASIATGDLEGSMAEIERTAKLGFRALTLPCKPVWGGHDVDHVNYNLPHFDPMWALIEETGMPITFHVSTGRDPRASRGNGGAIINYVTHSLAPTIEPVANLCASGVLQRFPKIRFATIEAGIGWVPWLLTAMDEAYKKHHMWVRPKLDGLPSDYYRAHGFATFQEDAAGIDLAEKHALADNFMWANDYPHHEGSWPHSAQAIERTMGQLSEAARAKILGLNAARLFGFDVPDNAPKG